MIQFNLVSVTDSASSFSLYFVKQTHLQYKWKPTCFGFAPERRCSSRTFRYGYLVTTSPQLSDLPSAAPSYVRSPTSGISDSHGVTGGVYKARERIHRGMLIRDY